MAFVNELIPDEAKKTFDFSIFKRHGGPHGRSIDVSSPRTTWTIDHERNAFLICRDPGLGPDGQGTSRFSLWWNGEVASVAALQEWHQDVQPRVAFLNWNFVDVYLPAHLELQRSEWTEATREALLAHGDAGGIKDPTHKPHYELVVTVNFTEQSKSI